MPKPWRYGTGQLDCGYIEEQLTPLTETKGDPAFLGILAKLRRL